MTKLYLCSVCGAKNKIVNQCGCDPYNQPTKDIEGLIRMGSHGDNETWRRWALFNRQEAPPVEEILDRLGWARYYTGPGRGFADSPTVREGAHKILIIQAGGLDV